MKVSLNIGCSLQSDFCSESVFFETTQALLLQQQQQTVIVWTEEGKLEFAMKLISGVKLLILSSLAPGPLLVQVNAHLRPWLISEKPIKRSMDSFGTFD